MGYAPASAWEARTGPAARFLGDYRGKTELNRRILNHLLHDAFRGDDGTAVDPIVDLVLDPDPAPELVSEVLGTYPFRDRATAHQNLLALAREDFPFLSQARCRHFLAAIAPRLLEAVGRTPDPDMTLTNLEKVSASLGAKAVLWELFNFNPPSLRLYVELCATSQFLSEILINNPGMIDDLVDSLVVDRPVAGRGDQAGAGRALRGGGGPGADPLELPEQGMGADRHPRHPGPRAGAGGHARAGRRRRGDRDPGRARPVAAPGERYGTPPVPGDGRRDRWAIVGLGKFGGRELNYHSDLDLIFLHEADGLTAGGSGVDLQRPVRDRGGPARCSRRLGSGSAAGPLYAVDARLRPARRLRAAGRRARRLPRLPARLDADLGADGLHPGPGRSSRRAGSARGDRGDPGDARRTDRSGATGRARCWRCAGSSRHRDRGSTSSAGSAASPTSSSSSSISSSSTPRGSRTCSAPTSGMRSTPCIATAIIDAQTHAELRDAYDFLRAVEGRLRLIQNRSVGELPEAPVELERLARRLNYESADRVGSVAAFLADMERSPGRTRAHFDRIITGQAARPT